MGNRKGLFIMVECRECKEKFELPGEGVELVSKKKYEVKGRSVYLTYYDCPKCGTRHFAQIDDDTSLKLLGVNEKQFVHNAVLRTTGKKLRKKKVDQYKDTHKHLANYRNKLMEEFEGEIVYNEDGSSFELRFSI